MGVRLGRRASDAVRLDRVGSRAFLKRKKKTLAADTVAPKAAANPVVMNDGLTVDDTLPVDTITNRLANQVTVENNFVVGGTLLVDTIGVSTACVKHNVVVGLTTANKNFNVWDARIVTS